MKKFLFLLGATLLLAALVSCGGEASTTQVESGDTTIPAVTAVTTTTSTATTADPTANTTIMTTMETTTQAPETEKKPQAVYETVQNPVYHTGNDPWVVEHNGKYYYCFSSGNGVSVGEIASPHQVTDKTARRVYTAPSGTMYSSEYWAPELHYIQGSWYIYVAADDGNNDNHRMYVLKCTSQDPTKNFRMVGQITDPTNKWAIDGTVLPIGDELYFVWSGWEGDENVAQHIYIAHMSDPCTIDSERVMISTPTFAWEKVGNPLINEGPTALIHDGKIHIIYSASGSWTDNYCMGLLTFTGTDPLKRSSWKKSQISVFRQYPGVAYGPGHCSVTTAIDGSLWMIYHANLQAGTGWNGRSVWISPITFKEDGTPVFGRPQKEVQFPVALLPEDTTP